MDHTQILKIKQTAANLRAAGMDDDRVADYLVSTGIKSEDLASVKGVKVQADPMAVAGMLASGGPSAPMPWDSGNQNPNAMNELGQVAQNVGKAAIGLTPNQPMQIPPTTARMVGGAVAGAMTGGLGTALGSEALGQAAELVNKYVLGNPNQDHQTGLQRAGSAAFNVATQLPFAMRAPGFTPELEKYIQNRPGVSAYAKGGVEQSERLQNFRDFGIPETGNAGAITGSKFKQGAEKGFGYVPTSMGVMQENAKATTEATQEAGRGIISKAGEMKDPILTGSILVKGAEDFKVQAMTAFDRLYGNVAGLKNLNVDFTPVQRQAAIEMKRLNQGLKNASPGAKAILEDILERPQIIDFTQARALKSDLAGISRDTGSDVVRGKAQGIGAKLGQLLHEQMDQGAKLGLETGEFRRYVEINKGYKDFISTLENLSPITNATHPENALSAFSNAASKFPSSMKDLLELRATISPKDWNSVLANHIDDLMRAPPGQQNLTSNAISPTAFATRWNGNKLYQESKEFLFPQGFALRKELDKFATVAGALKDAESLANKSFTTPSTMMSHLIQGMPLTAQGGLGAMAGAALGGGAVGTVAAVGTALATPWVLAKAWTSAPVVRWMTEGLRLDPQNYTAWSKHIQQLSSIVAAHPEIAGGKELAQTMTKNLRQMQSQQEQSQIVLDRTQPDPQPSETRSKFYKAFNALQGRVNAMDDMGPTQRQEFARVNKDALGLMPGFNSTNATLRSLDKERLSLINNDHLGAKERRDALGSLETRMNNLAEKALRDARKAARAPADYQPEVKE